MIQFWVVLVVTLAALAMTTDDNDAPDLVNHALALPATSN
jgi:hypothetical protein